MSTPTEISEDEKLRCAAHAATGAPALFMLMKRGLWYRPNAHGYTSHVAEAWKITGEEADRYVYPHDEPVTKHAAPIPDYLNSLDAMRQAEAALTEAESGAFACCLQRITMERGPFAWAFSTARDRCRAFLHAKGVAPVHTEGRQGP